MTLTIISHTEHYLTDTGTIVGLGSTVTEINHLLHVFDTISHVAMLHEVSPPANALSYISDKIKFVPLPVVGGTSFKSKLDIINSFPNIIRIINSELRNSDYFQFRAPTGIGVFVIPFLMYFINNKGWYKYAGNWKQPHAPLAYSFQKWLLSHQSRPVTINGVWKDQPEQCLSFENPCLTEEEVRIGRSSIDGRKFEYPLNFCFVGRLEAAKGLDLILNAFINLNETVKDKVGKIHIVGDGERLEYYKQKVSQNKLSFVFHGLLARKDVQEIYKQSHVLLLPSASEGFPKVIAEAVNYGCIPIVSNVSSIGQYVIDAENGFLIKNLTIIDLQRCIYKVLDLDSSSYRDIIEKNRSFSNSFTFSHYNKRILKDIL